MITTRTTSARRDGRTAATVPDEEVRAMVRDLWLEHHAAGRHRPKWVEVKAAIQADTARAWRLMADMEAAGELPDLPRTARQKVHTRGSLGYWGDRDRRQKAEDAARLAEARAEKERALRGRPRPGPKGPTVRDLVGQVRAAERRIGLGRAG